MHLQARSHLGPAVAVYERACDPFWRMSTGSRQSDLRAYDRADLGVWISYAVS